MRPAGLEPNVVSYSAAITACEQDPVAIPLAALAS